MQGSKNREWLIKSSGEIRGPFTFDEIAKGLATKEFIVVDEISRAFSRWKYLRDEEAFESIIVELKNRDSSRSDKTFTNSETDTLTEDLSKNVVNFTSQNALLSNIEDHLKEKEESRINHQKTMAANARREEAAKTYALESELKKKTSSGIFSKILLVLIISIGVGYYILPKKKEKILSYDDLKKIAYESINYGDFHEAKIYLEKSLAVNSTNEELKYLLSYVSVELEDSLTAQRLLDDLIRTASDKKLKSQALNLNGILQLKNFNLKEATKNFKAALNISPKFAAAFFNMGVAQYLENKFDLAFENFTQSLVSGGADGSILLAMAEMSTRQGQDLKTNPVKKKQAEDTLNLLNRQSNNMPANRQELKIAGAYLYHYLDNKELMQKNIEEAINVDPDLTTDHVTDVSFYKGLVTWERLGEWIKKLRDTYPDIASLKTFYGYALFKGSDKLKGKDIIEGLLKSNYSNTSNQILHSYILMTLKRNDEARAALAPIMHRRDKSLSFVLMGKLCLEKRDYPCADLNFSEALRIDKNNFSAQAGLSEVYVELKDYKKSQDLMRQVYKVSPTYKPILKVKQKLEKIKSI